MTRVHQRVHLRHPEIEDADVVWAWENYAERANREAAEREMRIGFDLKAREIEMVGKLLVDGDWLVYHAMTPPTKKTHAEMERVRRNKR